MQPAFMGAAKSLGKYPREIFKDSPTAFWRFGEKSGAVAQDSSPSKLNGTYSGGFTLGTTGLLTGDVNSAVTLNGSTGYVVAGSSSILNYSRNFTVEAWIKPNTVSIVNAIISHGVGGFYLRINASNKLEFLKSQTSSIGAGSTSLANNTRYHVALTINGSGNWVIYLNGASDGSGTTATTFNATGAGVIVGMDYFNAYNAEPFHGIIDDVAIYNSALSSARILAHYNAGV